MLEARAFEDPPAIGYPTSMPADELPPKREVAEALLEKGSVFVHLDPRLEGVDVPRWLADRPQLVLQIGLEMPVPIPDLRLDALGVMATLSFSRVPYACTVPWDAVFALVGDDGRGMVWPEHLPEEIAAEVEREARRRSSAPPGLDAVVPPPERRAARPALAVIEGGAGSRNAGEGPDGSTPGPKRRSGRPHLRRVK